MEKEKFEAIFKNRIKADELRRDLDRLTDPVLFGFEFGWSCDSNSREGKIKLSKDEGVSIRKWLVGEKTEELTKLDKEFEEM